MATKKTDNPYLNSVKIEIEWELSDSGLSRRDIAEIIGEIRVLLGEWGGKYRLTETTGKGDVK